MTQYFDFAAATPISERVQEAMRPYISEKFYNPSALYLAAQDVKKDIFEAKQTVATALGCRTSEIIFTAGGTESDNLAIRGVMERFPDASCVVSAIEHEAVLAPARYFNALLVPVFSDGRIDVDKLERTIRDDTVLVSVMYANNEIGTVQPMNEIAKRIAKIKQQRKESGNKLPLYFHTDACQAANYLPLLVHTLDVDLMTLNGGKIYGPKQSGILYIKTGVEIVPQILGGGQERGLRSGTENVPQIIGFASALNETSALRSVESERLRQLQHYIVSELSLRLPEAVVNGHLQYRLPNNVHITIPGVDNERLLMELDERGCMVATGSACNASSGEPSHVLAAIGLDDASARSSLRITFGRTTDQEAVDTLIDTLVGIVAR